MADRAVRPLGIGVEQDDPRPPRIGLGVALLVAGGLAGWTVASLGGGSTTTTTTTITVEEALVSDAIVARDTRPVPTIDWIRAEAVPRIPDNLEYAGTSNVVELDGTIFVVFNLRNPETGEQTSELWQSPDGAEWSGEQLDIGEPVIGQHLAVFEGSLLMTAQSGDRVVLLRSVPGRAIGGSSWTSISLPGTGEITPRAALTAVSREGKVMTLAIGSLDIWRSVVEPLLPPEIDLDDPRYVFREDGALFLTSTDNGADRAEVIPFLAEEPEVVVTADAVWVRLVTEAGEEVLQTFPVPAGAYPIRTDAHLADIQLLQAWVSGDGMDFLQVTGPSSLPEGLFLPQPWGDGFIAAASRAEDSLGSPSRVTFLSSTSGRAWRVDREQPPADCSRFSAAIGAGRILVTGEDGTRCIREIDTGWEVLPDVPDTAAVVGGDAGFIAYPNSFDYERGRFSRDGITWADIDIPALAPYPTLAVLSDRLIAISIDRPRPDRPPEVGFWVGAIS